MRRIGTKWVEVGNREWGDVHKELLAEMKNKTAPLLEKHKATLHKLLIKDVIYRVLFWDELSDLGPLKQTARFTLLLDNRTGQPFLHAESLILRDQNQQYQITHPNYEDLEGMLLDTEKLIQEETERQDGVDKLAKLGVDRAILKPLQSFHSIPKRNKTPNTKRSTYSYLVNTWESLPEQELGTIHRELYAELEKKWAGVFDKLEASLGTLAVSTVEFRCFQVANPKDPESYLKRRGISLGENGTIYLDAILVREGLAYAIRYPDLDETLVTYLAEQAGRVVGVASPFRP